MGADFDRQDSNAGLFGRPRLCLHACGVGYRSKKKAERATGFLGSAEDDTGCFRGAVHAHAPDAGYPAQQDSCLTSFEKVCAASFNPSTIVRYGKSWLERFVTVMRWWMASAAV